MIKKERKPKKPCLSGERSRPPRASPTLAKVIKGLVAKATREDQGLLAKAGDNVKSD